jgi:uncharacterized membrane protein
MSLFRTLAYLSPFLVGFGISAALALTAERPPKRRAVAAGAVVGAVLVVLLLVSFADSVKLWLQVALLIVPFALLVAGIYLLCEAAKAPREVSQVVAGLAVCVLMSTVFVFGPIIRDTADTGASGAAISQRIGLMMDVSPLMVMGESIFGDDLLHRPYIYRLDLAGYQHPNPSWPVTSAGYGVVGAALVGVSFGLRRLRKTS